MPLLVDGHEVPASLIEEEIARVRNDPRWRTISEDEKEAILREAGEYAAVSRVLVELAAERDPRPLDTGQVDAEVERIRRSGSCRDGFESAVRQQVERAFRIQRIVAELTSNTVHPTEAEMESFYTENRDNFRRPGTFQASHIIKNVNKAQPEEQGRAAIEMALADLERGEDFAIVADRYSDCKGDGGDLGVFVEGVMVEQFEQALQSLQPGQRTGIFVSPLGFHIAKLRAWTPGGPAFFEDVRPDIEKVLLGMRHHLAFQDGVEGLRAKATIIRTPDGAERNDGEGTGPVLHS